MGKPIPCTLKRAQTYFKSLMTSGPFFCFFLFWQSIWVLMSFKFTAPTLPVGPECKGLKWPGVVGFKPWNHNVPVWILTAAGVCMEAAVKMIWQSYWLSWLQNVIVTPIYSHNTSWWEQSDSHFVLGGNLMHWGNNASISTSFEGNIQWVVFPDHCGMKYDYNLVLWFEIYEKKDDFYKVVCFLNVHPQ